MFRSVSSVSIRYSCDNPYPWTDLALFGVGEMALMEELADGSKSLKYIKRVINKISERIIENAEKRGTPLTKVKSFYGGDSADSISKRILENAENLELIVTDGKSCELGSRGYELLFKYLELKKFSR